MQIRADHPKVPLTFYIYERNVTDEDANGLRSVVESLAPSKAWLIEPPRFFEHVEAPRNAAKDNWVRRVGGRHLLYTALPPWGQRLPEEADEIQLREVEAIVKVIQEFSRKTGRSVAFIFDDTDVGWIHGGNLDKLLEEGLLKPWREEISRRKAARAMKN